MPKLSVVIYGPQGSGKTRHGEALRLHFHMDRVVEFEAGAILPCAPYRGKDIRSGAVILCLDSDLYAVLDLFPRNRQQPIIMSIDQAKRLGGIQNDAR